MSVVPITFDEALPIINQELLKRRSKWNLQAVNEMDYDDVSQIIRIHIYNKFSKYDRSQPFLPWINTIISNQIKNLLRNKYYSFERPCLRCAGNQGEDLCSLTSSRKQCTECPLYAKWAKTKKSAHDVKLTVSIENHSQEVSNKFCDYFDTELAIIKLTKKLKISLKPIEWKVYELLYIQHKTENQVASIMGYRTSEKGRNPGYKRIRQIKKSIIAQATSILKEGLD